MTIFAGATWNTISPCASRQLEMLKHFTEKGLLVKEGAINAPIYFLAKDNKGNEDNKDNEISLHTKRLEP